MYPGAYNRSLLEMEPPPPRLVYHTRADRDPPGCRVNDKRNCTAATGLRQRRYKTNSRSEKAGATPPVKT